MVIFFFFLIYQIEKTPKTGALFMRKKDVHLAQRLKEAIFYTSTP